MTENKGFFLPYQSRWLNDTSRVKIWRKARRIGATYVQSYEDVRDALKLKINGRPCDVWFSSADITAAREYIEYCIHWAKLFNAAVQNNGEVVIDEKKDIKAFSLEFKNGARINALSSNPTQFRSKGGKVVLDEFAFHSDATTLWKAARPVISWGYPLRIISTENGLNCLYYQFIKKIKSGLLNWNLHETPIYLAAQEGLVAKILGKPKATEKEIEEWLNAEKADCADEQTWQQEYCCMPIDESTAFFTYEMLDSIKEKDVLLPFEQLETCKELYIGFDVARNNHLSVISVLEKVNNIKFLRHIVILKNTQFRIQKRILYKFLELKNVKRCCIDETGIGKQLAEDAQIDYGRSKVEPFSFTNKSKGELMYLLNIAMQDKNIIIDLKTPEAEIEDYHSIKKFTTSSGATRFDEDGSSDAHADRCMALALANYAASNKNDFQNPKVYSKKANKNNPFGFGLNLKGFRSDLRGGMF